MSDILIKNMEIPKDYKYVDVRIFCDGTATTASAEEPFYKKMDVVEVPPHGRLIDADALEKCGEIVKQDQGYYYVKGIALTSIYNAPTIIEEER